MKQFRVAQIFESYKASPNNPRETGPKISEIKIRLLESLFPKWVVRSFLIQSLLLLEKAALMVYDGNQEEAEVEVEAILANLENLPDAPDIALPEGMKTIVEFSIKNIIFSLTVISLENLFYTYRSNFPALTF